MPFQEFFKFLITSGLATLVNIAARFGLSFFIVYEFAIIIAHIIGMVVAFLLARKFVFDVSGHNIHRELTGFTIVNILSLAQVWLISVFLYRFALPQIEWTIQPALTAHIIGVCSLVFTSYFGHKYISFPKKTA
ncbi:MAG: GtrA family protein [Maricaulaceae bacterium]